MCMTGWRQRAFYTCITCIKKFFTSLALEKCILFRTLNWINVRLAQDEMELTLSRALCHHSSDKVRPSSFSHEFLVASGDDNDDKINFTIIEMNPQWKRNKHFGRTFILIEMILSRSGNGLSYLRICSLRYCLKRLLIFINQNNMKQKYLSRMGL